MDRWMRLNQRIVLVVVPVALIGALAGCGDLLEPDLSPSDVDSVQARNALISEEIDLPADYVFIAGVAYPPGFSGHTGYRLMFEARVTLFDDSQRLQGAYVGDSYDREFSEFRPIDCGAGLLATARQKRWTTCDSTTRAKYITNDATNPDSTDVGYGSAAIVLVADAEKTQVHVVIGGT
ncbi:hypothetical protein [Gordonia sp. CPCC 205333]|uniref:hypothetical protein n=1 Tax=Gordonia sp. CPCC 205333 TaxID=3140790 RepID=UPI003AF35E74